jgi:dienelactone hydrolase
MRRLALLLTLPVLLAAGQPVARDMKLASPDGFVLTGTLTVPANHGLRPVVILAHPFQGDRTAWKPLAEALNGKGIATLTLDLRGHGLSTVKGEGKVAVTADFKASAEAVGFDRIPGDLALAAAWARKQPRIDGHRLGLAGAGLGATCALLAAPAIHPVAVLALSPTGDLGDKTDAQVAKAVGAAKAAVFVTAALEDPAALARANAIKDLTGVNARLSPGKGTDLEGLPELTPLMTGWFSEYLGRRLHAARPAADKKAEDGQAADKPAGAEKMTTEEVK